MKRNILFALIPLLNLLFASTSAASPIVLPSISVTIAGTNCTCFGQCNGSALATPVGGTAPYTYSWSAGGFTTANATGLCDGTYTCSVTDQTGASTSATVVITVPATITISITSVKSSCTAPTGSAAAAVTGGTTPYTYSWSPAPAAGQGTANPAGMGVGTYTLALSDKNGCSQTGTVTITTPAAPTANITSSLNVYCFGACTGSATVTASGGTSPYTYNWSPAGGNTSHPTGLCANQYTVVVMDHNGCSASCNVNITQNAALAATHSSTPASCNTCANGTATLTATMGNSPYTYSWSPTNATTATDTGLAPGTYTCCVTDAAACQVCDYAITVAYSTGIVELENELSFQAYPNPFSNSFQIEINGTMEEGEIILYNMLGEELQHQQLQAKHLEVNTAGLPGGMYLVFLKTKQGVVIRRLSKE
jgi:hypothetical protein